MGKNLSDIMSDIQGAEAEATAKRNATLEQVAQIERQTADKIAKLNDEAKKSIEAKVAGKDVAATTKTNKSQTVSVDKKRRDAASKYVLDAFWSFIK